MGPQTQQALHRFQNAKGLLADEGMPLQVSGSLGDAVVQAKHAGLMAGMASLAGPGGLRTVV